MSFNWLQSKAISVIFFCSAVVFSSLCAFAFLIAIPSIRQFLNTSWANQPAGILFASFVVLSIPSVVVLFCGMAVFCAWIDRCSIGAKVLWFALFLMTGPIGSTVYYFLRYRGYVRPRAPDATPEPGVVGL
jgi:hypothetical protein